MHFSFHFFSLFPLLLLLRLYGFGRSFVSLASLASLAQPKRNEMIYETLNMIFLLFVIVELLLPFIFLPAFLYRFGFRAFFYSLPFVCWSKWWTMRNKQRENVQEKNSCSLISLVVSRQTNVYALFETMATLFWLCKFFFSIFVQHSLPSFLLTLFELDTNWTQMTIFCSELADGFHN